MGDARRPGFSTLTPRIVVDDVASQIAFLRARVRATGELATGAMSLEEPLDTPYGDRRAMVRDPFGNVFQIAHVLP